MTSKMKLSFRELQKICSDNKDVLPAGTRCGGKGVTHEKLEAVLRTAGVLPAEKVSSVTVISEQSRPSRGSIKAPSVAQPTKEEIIAPKEAVNYKPDESLHPPTVEYEQSRVVMNNFVGDLKTLGELGEGAFGTVTRVSYTDGRVYALKTLPGAEETEFPSFLVEASHLLRLEHPNIVNVEGIEAQIENAYILFELYDGDLFGMLRGASKWSNEKRLRYAYDIVAGIAYMHSRDVMHLDLKPHNILYSKKDDRLVIADFGLSESLFCPSGAKNTLYDLVTAFWRPPEVFFYRKVRNPTHGFPVDVWAVGLIILELAGQGRLFDPQDTEDFIEKAQAVLGDIDQELWPHVPEITTLRPKKKTPRLARFKKSLKNDALFDLCLSMLAYDPARRPTMYEVLKNPVFDPVREASRDVPLISCLDRLYMRRLGKSENPVTAQTEINSRMIDILWDWLIKVGRMFKLDTKTLYLTRHIIDEGMPDNLARKDLQLHGCACLLVASMVSETYAPELGDMVYISNGAFNKGDLAKKMAKIATKITCDLVLTTANEFIKEYASVAYPDQARQIVTVARIVGLLYLYSDYYYQLEAYEIAVSALYYATAAMSLPFRLSSLMAESKIFKPKIKPEYHRSIIELVKSKAKGIIDDTKLITVLENLGLS